MHQNNINKMNSNKNSSFLFAIIYILVLTITSFHFHTSDITSIEIEFENFNQSSKSHLFSNEECPIIIFSTSGFNSIQLSEKRIDVQLNRSVDYLLFTDPMLYQNFVFNFTSRGPPSYKIT